MNNSTKEMENNTVKMFLDEFGNIIKGLSTPEDLAVNVFEYVVTKKAIINIDYNDVKSTLHGMKEGDGMLIDTEKANLQSTLKDCEMKLKNAHPNMKMRNMLLQIISPQQSPLEMDDMQIFNDFFSSLGEGVQVTWGIISNEDISDKFRLFVMAGFND